MKKLILFCCLYVGGSITAQNITFKGCPDLLEDQFYTFNFTGTDGFGKNIYITTPVSGDQPCGGLGTCELKIQWNNVKGRWDFLADSGNGDFVNPYLLYYTTTANSSEVNPPNVSIGNWTENTAETLGACGGKLTPGNSTLTGDVRSTSLGLSEIEKAAISIYPNPASDYIVIEGMKDIRSLKMYAMDGKLIYSGTESKRIDVSKLAPGTYILQVETGSMKPRLLKFIKK